MPKRDNSAAIAAAAVIIGLGTLVAAAVASGSPDRNAQFVARLRLQLQPHAIVLLGAQLGRDVSGPVWVVTIQTPNAPVAVLHAQVAPASDPLATAVCDNVAQRVVAFVSQGG